MLGLSAVRRTARDGGGWGNEQHAKPFVRLTDQRFTRKRHPRASGQAARRLPRLKKGSEEVSCKRRDAVRLAQYEPARPAGAVFGLLSVLPRVSPPVSRHRKALEQRARDH